MNRLYRQLYPGQILPSRYATLRSDLQRGAYDAFMKYLMREHGFFSGNDAHAVDTTFQHHLLAQTLLDVLQVSDEDVRLNLAGYAFAQAVAARLTLAQTRTALIAHINARHPTLDDRVTPWAADVIAGCYRPALVRQEAAQLAFGEVECANLEAGIALAQASGLEHRSADLHEIQVRALTAGEALRHLDGVSGARWYPHLAPALDFAFATRQISLENYLAPDAETLTDATKSLDQARALVLQRTLERLNAPLEDLMRPVQTYTGMAHAKYRELSEAGTNDPRSVLRCPRPNSAMGDAVAATATPATPICRELEADFNNYLEQQTRRIEEAMHSLLRNAFNALPAAEYSFLKDASHTLYRVSLRCSSASLGWAETPQTEDVPLRAAVIVEANEGNAKRYYLARLIGKRHMLTRLPDTHDVQAFLSEHPDWLIDSALRRAISGMSVTGVQITPAPVAAARAPDADDFDHSHGWRPTSHLDRLTRHLAQLWIEPLGVLAAGRGHSTLADGALTAKARNWRALTLFQPCAPDGREQTMNSNAAYCVMGALPPNSVRNRATRLFDGLLVQTASIDSIEHFDAEMRHHATQQAPTYLAAWHGVPMRAGERLAALARPARDHDIDQVLSSIPTHYRPHAPQLLRSEPLRAEFNAPLLRDKSMHGASLAAQAHRSTAYSVEYLPEKNLWRSIHAEHSAPTRGSASPATPYTLRTVVNDDHVMTQCVARDCSAPNGLGSRYAYYWPASGLPYGRLLQPTFPGHDATLYEQSQLSHQWPAHIFETGARRGDREFHLPPGTRVQHLPIKGEKFLNLELFEIDDVLYGVRKTGGDAPLERLSDILQRGEARAFHCRTKRGRQDKLDCLDASRREIGGQPAVLLEDTNNPIFQELPGEGNAPPLNEQSVLFIDDVISTNAGEFVYRVWHNHVVWHVHDVAGSTHLVALANAPVRFPETLTASLLGIDGAGGRRWAVQFMVTTHGNVARTWRQAEVFRTFTDGSGQWQGLIYADPDTLYAFPLPSHLIDGIEVTLRQPSEALRQRYRAYRHAALATLAADSQRHHVEITSTSREVTISILNAYLPERVDRARLLTQTPDADPDSRGESLVRAFTDVPLDVDDFHECTDDAQRHLCNILNHPTLPESMSSSLIAGFNALNEQNGDPSRIRTLTIDNEAWRGILQELPQYFPGFRAPSAPSPQHSAQQAADAMLRAFRTAFKKRNVAYAELRYQDGEQEFFFAASGGGDNLIAANNCSDARWHNSLQEAWNELDEAGSSADLATFLAHDAPDVVEPHLPTVNSENRVRLRAADSESLIVRNIFRVLAARGPNASAPHSLRLVTRLNMCHSCLLAVLSFRQRFPDVTVDVTQLNMRSPGPSAENSPTGEASFAESLRARGAVGGTPPRHLPKIPTPSPRRYFQDWIFINPALRSTAAPRREL
ncbi:MAG: deaminase domain-containing protein [Janthinobacterium lividum]